MKSCVGLSIASYGVSGDITIANNRVLGRSYLEYLFYTLRVIDLFLRCLIFAKDKPFVVRFPVHG